MNASSVLRIAMLAPLVMLAIFSRSDVGAPQVRAQESCLLRGRGEVGTILTTARPFDRWALVIGVSRFQYGDKEVGGRQISNLRGPENDARSIADFLLTPEGGEFPPGHIKVVRNEEATRTAVIEGLEWLRGVAKPDDYFVIFFASHGDVEESEGREIPYFIVHDTDPRDFANTAVKMDVFFETIKNMPGAARAGAGGHLPQRGHRQRSARRIESRFGVARPRAGETGRRDRGAGLLQTEPEILRRRRKRRLHLGGDRRVAQLRRPGQRRHRQAFRAGRIRARARAIAPATPTTAAAKPRLL